MLHPRRVETIEVLDDTYMFFKVVTKDMLAPGKINFSYADGQHVRSGRVEFVRSSTNKGVESPASPSKPKLTRKKVELSVYFSVSEKNREPTKENCDKSVDSPVGAITMPMVGKDRFENEEVYVSLYSLTGCTVNLTVLFPDLKVQGFSRKQIMEDYVDEHDFENYLVCQKWRKMNRNLGTDKNCFIQNNTKQVGNYLEAQAFRQ